jgi:hypothetical protein
MRRISPYARDSREKEGTSFWLNGYFGPQIIAVTVGVLLRRFASIITRRKNGTCGPEAAVRKDRRMSSKLEDTEFRTREEGRKDVGQ